MTGSVAANDGKHLSSDVACTARRREKYEGWSDLLRLGGACHRRAAAELGHVFGLPIGRIERGPYRPGRHDIDSNSTLDQVRGQGPGEGVDSSLGHRVV